MFTALGRLKEKWISHGLVEYYVIGKVLGFYAVFRFQGVDTTYSVGFEPGEGFISLCFLTQADLAEKGLFMDGTPPWLTAENIEKFTLDSWCLAPGIKCLTENVVFLEKRRFLLSCNSVDTQSVIISLGIVE